MRFLNYLMKVNIFEASKHFKITLATTEYNGIKQLFFWEEIKISKTISMKIKELDFLKRFRKVLK